MSGTSRDSENLNSKLKKLHSIEDGAVSEATASTVEENSVKLNDGGAVGLDEPMASVNSGDGFSTDSSTERLMEGIARLNYSRIRIWEGNFTIDLFNFG